MTTVQERMERMPLTIGPDDSVHKAAQIMRDNDLRALAVIDPRNVDDLGVLVGIVTDRDIVLKSVAEGRGGDTPVRHCMTHNVETAMPDTPLEQALIVMNTHQIDHLPIVDYGRLVGMIARADLAPKPLA